MRSEFDGTLLGMIGIGLLSTLICILTLGIGMPWAICLAQRWYADHTIIDDRQLTFDGKGIRLFGVGLKWLFFSIITLGIYTLWLPIKMQAWITFHTHSIDIHACDPVPEEQIKEFLEASEEHSENETKALPEANNA